MVNDPKGNDGHISETNIGGDVHGSVYSGQFFEPVTVNHYTKPATFCFPLQKPPRPEKFIGRGKELSDLLRDIQSRHSVTVCGTGGMGKTALVSEALWRLSPDNNPPATFPDGIIFHDFYRQPQSAIALEAIASVYGENLRPNPSAAARRALAGRRALLVLDGAEATDDLNAVLDIAGSCGILITTQKKDDAPDDWIELAPLKQDQAVKLLQEWGKEWAVDEAASNEICELLGGLPLAIFLAGRYLAQHNQLAAEYLEWLVETPLEALDMGERRHQSIPLLMEQSLKRISEMGCASLGAAGILALEPFESKLIQIALRKKPRDIDRTLGELINYGLVQRSESHYQVTHALIRTFARERLVPERISLLRLARYYSAFVKTQCEFGLSGYACLDSHRAHVLALLAMCIDASEWDSVGLLAWELKDYLDLQGHWTERLEVLKAGLLASRSKEARKAEAEFLNLLGTTYGKLGNSRLSIKFLKEALEVFRRQKDLQGEGKTLGNIGLAYYYLGDNNQAISYFERDLIIARDAKDLPAEVSVLNNMGMVYVKFGDSNGAIKHYELALTIARKIGDKKGECNVLGNLGTYYLSQRDYSRSIYYSNQSLFISQDLGDISGEGKCINSLGIACYRLGDYKRAIEYQKHHLEISRRIGDSREEGNALLNMALALDKMGERQEATDLAKAALDIYEQIESPQAEIARRKLAEWGEEEEQP
ncbi:MAG: tetratricopeptide repeat protein [Methanothrix sp.]|nr:tetratricopeptide repeat protein [Methanothrix sp.]